MKKLLLPAFVLASFTFTACDKNEELVGPVIQKGNANASAFIPPAPSPLRRTYSSAYQDCYPYPGNCFDDVTVYPSSKMAFDGAVNEGPNGIASFFSNGEYVSDLCPQLL